MKKKKIPGWKRTPFITVNFWDILKLVEEKERKGLTISLCIPTLNEEKTIGKEVLILRSELMERYPLVDEFAVIDSGSQDKTLEVAGITERIHISHPTSSQKLVISVVKGKNLWKAIHQLKGDIICYVDADITNIHPRFVYGLVAPLINRDEIQYVKAFYDRPLNYSSGLRPRGWPSLKFLPPTLFFVSIRSLQMSSNPFPENMLPVVKFWKLSHSPLVMESRRLTFSICIINWDLKPLPKLTLIVEFTATKPPPH